MPCGWSGGTRQLCRLVEQSQDERFQSVRRTLPGQPSQWMSDMFRLRFPRFSTVLKIDWRGRKTNKVTAVIQDQQSSVCIFNHNN